MCFEVERDEFKTCFSIDASSFGMVSNFCEPLNVLTWRLQGDCSFSLFVSSGQFKIMELKCPILALQSKNSMNGLMLYYVEIDICIKNGVKWPGFMSSWLGYGKEGQRFEG